MTDWILRGGEVIDGSGRPRRRADVAIAGDRIAAVGMVAEAQGAREIHVSGKIVAPGFIDVHTHDDRALLATPAMAAKASQGVATLDPYRGPPAASSSSPGVPAGSTVTRGSG